MNWERQGSELIKFEIDGLIKPKVRPRFNGEKVYLPEDYRRWREIATIEIVRQAREKGLEFPIKEAIYLGIEYHGHGQGDADNVAGAIMDTLVQARIVENDNLKHIRGLNIEFYEARLKEARAIIKIYKIDKKGRQYKRKDTTCENKNHLRVGKRNQNHHLTIEE